MNFSWCANPSGKRTSRWWITHSTVAAFKIQSGSSSNSKSTKNHNRNLHASYEKITNYEQLELVDLKPHFTTVHEGKKSSAAKDRLTILIVNVQGLENKHLQVHNLLSKYKCSISVLSEVETTHVQAATANMQDYKVF